MSKYITLIIYLFLLVLTYVLTYKSKSREGRKLFNYGLKMILLCTLGFFVCFLFSKNENNNHLFVENINLDSLVELLILFIIQVIIFTTFIRLKGKTSKGFIKKDYLRKYLVCFIIPVIFDFKWVKGILFNKEIYSIRIWYIPYIVVFTYLTLKIYINSIGKSLSVKLIGYNNFIQTIKDMFFHQMFYVSFIEEFFWRIYISKYYTSLGVINVMLMSSLFFSLPHMLFMDTEREFRYKFIQSILIHSIMGMFLSTIWYLERSLIFNITLHISYNLVVLGYESSLLKKFKLK